MMFISVLREYCDSLWHPEKHPVSRHLGTSKATSNAPAENVRSRRGRAGPRARQARAAAPFTASSAVSSSPQSESPRCERTVTANVESTARRFAARGSPPERASLRLSMAFSRAAAKLTSGQRDRTDHGRRRDRRHGGGDDRDAARDGVRRTWYAREPGPPVGCSRWAKMNAPDACCGVANAS